MFSEKFIEGAVQSLRNASDKNYRPKVYRERLRKRKAAKRKAARKQLWRRFLNLFTRNKQQ